MKYLIIFSIIVANLTSFAVDNKDLDFSNSKYIIACGLSVNINQPNLSNPISAKSSSDVQFYIADKPDQKYSIDKKLVQRVYFRLDGGAALSLYQICKDKLNSADKRATLHARSTPYESEYMGTWVSHTTY